MVASGSPIDSFFVALGFDIDDSNVDEFKNKTNDLRQTILNVGLVAAGLAASLGLVIDRLIETNETMTKTKDAAEALNIAAVEMDNYNKVTELAGGSTEKMQAALGKIVDEGGRADNALGLIAKKMETLTRPQQIALGVKLGLDPNLSNELSRGYAHYLDLLQQARAANPFTEKDYENAKRVATLWSQIKSVFSGASTPLRILVAQLSNILIQIEETVLRILKPGDIAPWVRAMSYIATAIGDVWEWVKLLVSTGEELITWLLNTKTALIGVGLALASIMSWNTWLTAGIVAVAAAFALIADDIRAYLQGQQSYLGYLEKRYPIVHKVILAIGDAVHWLGDQFSYLSGLVSEAWDYLAAGASAAWPVIKSAAVSIWEFLKPIWEGVKAAVVENLPLIKNLASQGFDFLLGILRQVAAILPVIGQFLSDNRDTIMAVVRALAPLIEAWLAYKIASWAANEGVISKNQESLLKTIIWVASMIKTFMGLRDMITAIFKDIGDAFDWLGDKASQALKFVTGGLSGLAGKFGIDVSADGQGQPVIAGVASALQGSDANVLWQSSGIGKAIDAASPAASSSVIPQSNSSSTTTSSTVTNHISAPITIQAPDAQAAGDAVKSKLDSTIRNTTRNGQSQVVL